MGAGFHFGAAVLLLGSASAAPLPPTVVGVPPNYAARDLCVTADGEIRHYGFETTDGVLRRVYTASRDGGRNWTTVEAATNDVGAMVRSPWSGEWLYFTGLNPVTLVRSATGPGDTAPRRTVLPWKKLELRQMAPLRSRRRWLAVFSNVACEDAAKGADCYHATAAVSDDDGLTWKRTDLKPVAGVARMTPGDQTPHWFNNGCEPTFVELGDGTILLCVRTSGPHAAFYRSTDGGETWGEGVVDEAFWQANTMPYLFRLRDGRILFFWNNTQLLPTRPAAEHPELSHDELIGRWETVFTNRDALHAAISDDDGGTWKGFREVALNEIRNAADFRELGNGPHDERDKSVHQTQAVELPDGKVLLAYGQNRSARRMLVFDPDWLLETSRYEDFRHGLGNLSNHLYVRSLSGGWRGWAGHCAWNRVPGALLVRDPDTDAPPPDAPRSVREVLQLCRIRDPRLVDDRQGVVWNFPAARSGRVTLDCRVEGAPFRFALTDHWINPCDAFNAVRSPCSFEVSRETVGAGWHKVALAWDDITRRATLAVDGRIVAEKALAEVPRFGFSYIHLQTLAEDTDIRGAYFRSFAQERALANPAFPGLFSDPELLWSEQTGRCYIYPSTDGFPPDWREDKAYVFSSADMKDWRRDGCVFDLKRDCDWADIKLWAPCVIERRQRDGGWKYFWYFAAEQKLGVAVGNRPEGPFRDALGRPLLAKHLDAKGRYYQLIDPDVFCDPKTGTCYLYWGNAALVWAELKPSMTEIGEPHFLVDRDTCARYHYTEGTHVFYRKGLYYFSWSEFGTEDPRYCVRYLISDSPTAFVRNGRPAEVEPLPIVSRDETRKILGTGHHSVVCRPGTDEWYIAYHRFCIPNVEAGGNPAFNREVCVDRLVFADDGRIKPVVCTTRAR